MVFHNYLVFRNLRYLRANGVRLQGYSYNVLIPKLEP